MNLTSLFNIKGLAYSALGGALLSAAVAVPLTMWVTAMPLKLEISDLNTKLERKDKEKAEKNAADVSASLEQLQTFIGNMRTASKEYSDTRGVLFTQVNNSIQSLANAIKNKPLPPGCFPDPDRVRALYEAVRAANIATGQSAGTRAKPSPAVP